jgi:hypothetical protein
MLIGPRSVRYESKEEAETEEREEKLRPESHVDTTKKKTSKRVI